jgi:hypothetical protein
MAMYGIQVSELGGPEVLSYVEISQPAPGAGEVLINAEAISVNFSIPTSGRACIRTSCRSCSSRSWPAPSQQRALE